MEWVRAGHVKGPLELSSGQHYYIQQRGGTYHLLYGSRDVASDPTLFGIKKKADAHAAKPAVAMGATVKEGREKWGAKRIGSGHLYYQWQRESLPKSSAGRTWTEPARWERVDPYYMPAGVESALDRLLDAAPKPKPRPKARAAATLSTGLTVRSKENPEWGTWQVTGPARGVPGVWEIRSDRRGHSRTLGESEFSRFWEAVRTASAATTAKIKADIQKGHDEFDRRYVLTAPDGRTFAFRTKKAAQKFKGTVVVASVQRRAFLGIRPGKPAPVHRMSGKWYSGHGTVTKKKASKKVSRKSPADSQAATELVLYADNEGTIYQQRQSIEENLRKKYRKGKYDHSKAPKLWAYWMETAAKAYAKDFANASEWSTMFTKSTRELAAKEKADQFHDVLKVEETVEVAKPKAKKRAKKKAKAKPVHYTDFGWDAKKPFPNDGKGETTYRQGKVTIKIRYAPRGTYAAEIITDSGGWLPGLGGPTRAQALEATKNLLPGAKSSTTDPEVAKYTDRSYTRAEAEALLKMAYPYTEFGPNYKRNIHDAAADLILALQNEMASPVSTFSGILALRLAALGGHGREGLLAKLKKATKKRTKKAAKKKATRKKAVPRMGPSDKYPRVRIDFSNAEYPLDNPPPKGKRTVEEFDRWMVQVAQTESPGGGYNKIWPKIYVDGKRDPALEMRVDADRSLSEGRNFVAILHQRIAYNTRMLEQEPAGRVAQNRREMLPAWQGILDALEDAPRSKRKATKKKATKKKATKKKAAKKATKKKAKKKAKKKTRNRAAEGRKKRAKKKNVRKKARVAKKKVAPRKKRTAAEERKILNAWKRGAGAV